MRKGQAHLRSDGLDATDLKFTSRRRQLPNPSDMRKQNGPVKITKVGTVHKTKEQRKAWWNSLSQEEKARYTEKWENSRDASDRKSLDLPPLTQKQATAINDTMRQIGLERFIVLPDAATEEQYQETLAQELGWIKE